jgi:hypothetical protein
VLGGGTGVLRLMAVVDWVLGADDNSVRLSMLDDGEVYEPGS